jgi:rubrerythrin
MSVLQKEDFDILLKRLSLYHIRLIGYAKQAHKELKINIARLFEALAFSKQVQALCILNYMGYVGKTKENLSDLICGIETFRPDKTEENSDIRKALEQFEGKEEKSKHLYVCAKDSADVEKDLNIGDINVCSKCGYVLLGDTPKECEVCRSPSGYFRMF